MSASYEPLFDDESLPPRKETNLDTRTWAQVCAQADRQARDNPDAWLDEMRAWLQMDDATGRYTFVGGGRNRLHFFFSDHETAFRFKIRWG